VPVPAAQQRYGATDQAAPLPPKDSPHAVMSLGGYIGSTALINIPVIGWIMCVIWAVSAHNLNRRNYARMYLVLFGVLLISGIASIFLIYWLSGLIISWILNLLIGQLLQIPIMILSGFSSFDMSYLISPFGRLLGVEAGDLAEFKEIVESFLNR
jgi:hypothetical protein